MASKSRIYVVALLLCLLLCPIFAIAFVPPSSDQKILMPDASNNTMPSHITIDYSNLKSKNASDNLLNEIDRPGSTSHEDVHIITLEGWGSITNWTLLSSVLGKIDRLDELHWEHNDAPPSTILSTLEDKQPACKLFWDMSFSNWDRFDRDVPPIQAPGEEPKREARERAREGMVGSTSLYSLKTEISYGGFPSLEPMHLIQRIVQNAPNLRELDISLSHSGCVVSDGQPRSFDFSSSPTKFPPLKVLKLSGYLLDGRVDGKDAWSSWPYVWNFEGLYWPFTLLPTEWLLKVVPSSWLYEVGISERLDIPAEHANGTPNLDAWIKSMDWTHMESLSLDQAPKSTLEKLGPLFKSLKSFHLNWADCRTTTNLLSFLSNVDRPLDSISFQNIGGFESYDDLVSIIASKHNTSLESLHLHEYEAFREHSCWGMEEEKDPRCQNNTRRKYWTERPYLTDENLKTLRISSPNITSLDINIDRTEPFESINSTLSLIAAFPHLSQLSLRFDSPDYIDSIDPAFDRWSSSPHTSDDVVNRTFVNTTFHTLRKLQRQTNPSSSEPSLSNLEVRVGAWDTRHHSGMIGPDRFLLGHWECRLEDQISDVGVWEQSEVCRGGNAYPSYYGPSGDLKEPYDGFERDRGLWELLYEAEEEELETLQEQMNM